MVRVRLERPGGDESTVGFTLPARPQRARAKRLLAHTARRTRALRTVVIDAHLAPSERLALDTVFTIRAPDAMRYGSTQVEDGARTPAGEAIVIRGARWDARRSTGRWSKSEQEPLDQPVPDWRQRRDPSILGSGRLRGRPAWRVSFRDPTVPAWLEVAVDKRNALPLRVT